MARLAQRCVRGSAAPLLTGTPLCFTSRAPPLLCAPQAHRIVVGAAAHVAVVAGAAGARCARHAVPVAAVQTPVPRPPAVPGGGWLALAEHSHLGSFANAMKDAASRGFLLDRLKIALSGTATAHGAAAVCTLLYLTHRSSLSAHGPQDSGLQPRQAFTSTVVMDALAFAARYPEFEEWQQQRAAAAVAPNGLPLPRPRATWADPPPYANDDYDGELYDKAEMYDKGDSGDGAIILDGQASEAAGAAAAAAAAADRKGKGAAPKRKRGPRQAASGAKGKGAETAAGAVSRQAGPASPRRRGAGRRGPAKAAAAAGGGSGREDASMAAAAAIALPVPRPFPAQATPPLPLPRRQQVVRQPSGSSMDEPVG